MKRFLTFLSVLLLSVRGLARDFNPILPDMVADPSVSVFDGIYYLYGTTDIDRGLDRMGPPVVWKSADFVNWSFEGTILPEIDWSRPHAYTDAEGKQRTGYFRYWAPGAAVRKGDIYYLFPTIVKPDGSMGVYTLTAAHPEGPFRFQNGDGLFFPEPPAGVTESVPLVDDIDGEVFDDADGRSWFFWRRRYASRIEGDYSRLTGDRISIGTSRGGYSEGPVVFRRNGIYYYLYTLRSNQNYQYAYMMSTEGPAAGYRKPPSGNDIFLFSSPETGVWGPGPGNILYDAPRDHYLFLYLEYGEGGTTRQVFVNQMDFNDNGTIRTMTPDLRGVGCLGKDTKPAENLALAAVVSASSHREPKTVAVEIETRPNDPGPEGSTLRQVSRTFDYAPENAVDGYYHTRWIAAEGDLRPWFLLDLGRPVMLSTCEIMFTAPAFGHAWTLEKSLDGREWTVCGEQQVPAARSPHTAGGIGEARYLRLTFHEGEPGLWEIGLYE